jgi:hypothetical protein
MSSDPGTSSMGELMALALVCTMAAAVLFQPALMGPPRRRTDLREPDWIGVSEPRRAPITVVREPVLASGATSANRSADRREQPAEQEFER